MRKILILFVLTVMLLALTSCELLFSFFTEKHTHSYDSAWSYNTSEHYYSCQCGDIADLESHVDIDSLDGKCDVCGFKMHNVYTVTLVVGENINAKANHFSVVDGDTLSFLVTVPPKHTISVEGASTVGEPVLNSTGLGYVYTIRVEDVIADVTVFIEAWEVKPPCNHESVRYPTCTESGLCLLCGDNIGEAIGHRYSEPTCNKLSECSVCGDTVGDYAPHRWLDPTCSQPYLCTECGEMRGEALGHTGGAPNCDDAGICSRCSVEYISPLGHSWKDATCTTAKTCTVCEEIEGKPLGHSWKDATCTTAKTCTECGQVIGVALSHTLAYESLGDGTHKVYCVHIGCDLSYVEMCDGEPSLTEAAFCSICKAHYGDPLPPNESEGDNTLSVTIGDDNCAYTSIMVDSDGRYYFSISYDTEQYPESMPYVTIDLYGDGDHIELGEYADLTAGVRYSVRIIFYSGEDVEITYSQNQDESDTEDSYRVKRELLIGEDYSDKVEVTVEVSGLYVFNIEYDQKYIESPPYVTIIEDGGYIEYDVTYNVWLDAGVNYILSAIFYVGESVTVTLCLT